MSEAQELDVQAARETLGRRWGLGRSLSYGELARCLEMHPRGDSRRTHTDLGYDIERRPTGPQCVAIQAMLEGFIPRGAPSCVSR